MQRVVCEIATTFSSSYTAEVGLQEAVTLAAVRVYATQETGQKYLLCPQAPASISAASSASAQVAPATSTLQHAGASACGNAPASKFAAASQPTLEMDQSRSDLPQPLYREAVAIRFTREEATDVMGEALDDGDWFVVLGLMRSHPEEANIQELGCDALFRIMLDEPHVAKQLASDGIVTVLAAMQTHPDNGDVQKEAATTIWRIVNQVGFRAAKMVLDNAGFDLLMKSRKMFQEGTEAHEAALLALGVLEKHGLVTSTKPACNVDRRGCPVTKGKVVAHVLVY